MGVNNRAKRAAKAKQKAKQRARDQHASRTATDHDFWKDPFGAGQGFTEPDPTLLATSDLKMTVDRRRRGLNADGQYRAFCRSERRHQQRAVDTLLDEMISGMFIDGWTPDDFREITRRRTSASVSDFVLRVVAACTHKFDPMTVAPAWSNQLEDVHAAAGCRAWAAEHEWSWDEAREVFLELFDCLSTLPVLEVCIPAPGQWRRPKVDEVRGADDRILAKVRGLLAKAESTDFEEEAEALTAKAQDLMKTYSIEHALLTDRDEDREHPALRRIWIDAPYVEPKAMLINQVATSNRSRCVYSQDLGFVTVLGFAADLDTVELLSTSLLFQGSRAMRAEGTRRYRGGGSRTRSFRQSFLVAYASRIGQRLREASSETESRVDVEHDGRLLPVLAARDDEVADFTDTVFPNQTKRTMNVTDREGYGAGVAAADKAHIETRDAISDV